MKKNHSRKHDSNRSKHTQHTYKHLNENQNNINIDQAWNNMGNMNNMNKGDEELLPSQYGYGKMNKLRRAFPSLPSIFQDFSLKLEIG